MDFETGLFINNEVSFQVHNNPLLPHTPILTHVQYVSSASGETISVYNPADDTLVTDKIQVAGPEDVDRAVASAKAAFKTWRSTPTAQRAAIMNKYADLVEKHADQLALLETTNMGAPVVLTRMLVESQVASFRYYAGLVDKVHGETYQEDGDGLFKMITYEPLGVCAGISAWNGTYLSIGWKVSRYDKTLANRS